MAKTFIEDIVRNVTNERLLLGNNVKQPLFLTSDASVNADINQKLIKTTIEYEELAATGKG